MRTVFMSVSDRISRYKHPEMPRQGGRLRLRQRNLALVLAEPLIEGVRGRMERSREVDASRTEDLLFEVAIDLEHVAQLVGAGETEAAVGIRLDGVVLDVDAKTLRVPSTRTRIL